MNPYSDIPFYIQSLLSDEDDYGVILLLTLTPRYVAPEEHVDIFGMKIKRSGFKPQPKSNIWRLVDGGGWPADLPMTYTPKLKPIDYIVKTIDIIYHIEKEDVSKW